MTIPWALLKKLICVLWFEKGNTVKRGVVFINETFRILSLAWMANKLYNENTSSYKASN
jgi:hypothetical protein